MALDADTLIELLGLEPLPIEGGRFRRTYCSRETATGDDGVERPMGSAIYYLLTDDADSFSALHKLPTDEIYHFYLGDPVNLTLLEEGRSAQTVTLGQGLTAGQHVQFVAPANVWQGSKLAPGGSYALLGTTMAPGFMDADYIEGDYETLSRLFPDESNRILSLLHD